jgi:hypothetical protein
MINMNQHNQCFTIFVIIKYNYIKIYQALILVMVTVTSLGRWAARPSLGGRSGLCHRTSLIKVFLRHGVNLDISPC